MSVGRRENRSAEELAAKYKPVCEEGRFREAICQVLSDQPVTVRLRMLALYPELIVPYLWRLRRVRQAK